MHGGVGVEGETPSCFLNFFSFQLCSPNFAYLCCGLQMTQDFKSYSAIAFKSIACLRVLLYSITAIWLTSDRDAGEVWWLRNSVWVVSVVYCKTGCCFPSSSPPLECYVLTEGWPWRGSLHIPATSHANPVHIPVTPGTHANQGKYFLGKPLLLVGTLWQFTKPELDSVLTNSWCKM